MQNRFARAAQQTMTPDPLVPGAVASRLVARLAMLGYSNVTVAAICGKPLSEVVRLVDSKGSRTTAMLVRHVFRDELSRR